MKILVIGSGGREHAIASALHRSAHRPELFFAPGNAGMAGLGQRLEIDATDLQGLAIFAKREGIDLTVVGPEAPLAIGIVDRFQADGLKIFGPVKAAALLEASKHFAKQIMDEAQVPTAGYAHCLDADAARRALDKFQPPYVIKEDGLAAGKGVTIAQDRAEAEAAIDQAYKRGMTVVLEEFMAGEELSILAVCDGKIALPMVAAQDFKRVGNNNEGPNTGGMGAYAPVPLATPALMARVRQEVLQPVLEAMARRGTPYMGVLYAGLMILPDGTPKVVEFNVRFGDPETQVVLPLLEDDLVDLFLASANGDLSGYEAKGGIAFKSDQAAVTVVLASQGYPGEYESGYPIDFPASLPDDAEVFHAGTRLQPGGKIVTQGGRVLNVTGIGKGIEQARQRAYEIVEQVSFQGKYYRSDIAAKPSQPAH
jgi:phosphoribosylamine--glycine ligase